jgi:exosortase/archaeosortase family protein
MVLTHLLLRSPWRRWLVILLAMPLSVAKNAVRMVTLSLLGMHVDPSFLTGRLHDQGGIVFFSLSVIALWLLIRALQGRAVGQRPIIFDLKTARGTLDS